MRVEVLTEILKDFGRWLDAYGQAHRDLGRACRLIRRDLEHPQGPGDGAGATRQVVDLLFDYDPDRFAGVTRFFDVIAFADPDLGHLTRFLRRDRPTQGTPAREALEWLEDYHTQLGRIIGYVEKARAGVMRELVSPTSSSPPADPGAAPDSPTVGPEPEPPSPAGQSVAPENQARVPNGGEARSPPGGYLGLKVNEEMRTVERDGTQGEVDLSSTRGRLLWGLFKSLYDRRGRGVRMEFLRADWESLGGRTDTPEDSTIQDAVSRLKARLKPLGLSIEYRVDRGYSLE